MTIGKTAKTGIMAMAAALSVSQAEAKDAPAPVRIGIMDLKADGLTYDAGNVSIEYKAFTPDGQKAASMPERTGDDHGAVVASAFVRHYRTLDAKTPIEIYAGNPFTIAKRPDGRTTLRLNFDKGVEVLEWMRGKGVRVVVTAFNSSDAVGAARFMDRAEKLGMIVFAAYANQRDQGRVFPAGDERAVSVVDTMRGKVGFNVVRDAGRENDGAAVGVTFAMNGGVPQGAYGAVQMTGSSFASPKAAAYAAYALKQHPDMDRRSVVATMKVGSRPMATELDGVRGSIDFMGEAVSDERFMKEVRTMVATKGPTPPEATIPVKLVSLER